jgi:hypothetical protein
MIQAKRRAAVGKELASGESAAFMPIVQCPNAVCVDMPAESEK